ncbi:glycosyltransferase [Mycobacterium shigaense]|uniref:Glycosyl transferase n=1 Tax=Mycobacterium shigaense TaxID=722731 RepID=A0A1Z4EEV7_9MYCO|nr:glycosyltransferase [Mycobacterium shigaense]PRI16257.1 glycosyl transferase family 1 [Mycobacterium shigaense]BAX91493.1 glycosyl transferase [Mycobacterium shigaense]
MKIAIVTGDDVAGDDTARFAAALAAQHHDVTAYVRLQDQHRQAESGHRVVPIPVGPAVVRSAADVLPFVGEWAAALEDPWSSDEPDIVHAHGWLGGLAAQLAARRHKRPTVQTFRRLASASRTPVAGRPGKGMERRRIEPLLARNAAWATVESTADVEQYHPVGPAADRGHCPRILCMAPNPLPGNGFDIAVRALPRVPGAELVVAETDPNNRRHSEARTVLKRLAVELDVDDRVRLLGAVGGDDLPALVRSADLVACTPRRPPHPAAALRAMACGVAVVALPEGVLTDIVIDDVTGLVLSTHSLGELSAALRSLLSQDFRRNGMGAAGRSRALSRFMWDRVAQDALSIYRQLQSHQLSASPLQPAGVL